MASTNTPKKRGRPKSQKTLQKERAEAWLKNPPAHIPPMTDEEKQRLREFIKNSEEAKRCILEGHSPLLPHSLIYDLESLGDESMHGFEQSVLDQYKRYRVKELIARANGADQTALQADMRASKLWTKNKDLVNRIESGNLTPNGASKMIYDNWETRGIEGEKPTIKTIVNWYKRRRPN
jgi:hypothetical protein